MALERDLILSDQSKRASLHLLSTQGVARHLSLPQCQMWGDFSEPFAFFSTASSFGTSFLTLLFIHITNVPQSVLWCQLHMPEYTPWVS